MERVEGQRGAVLVVVAILMLVLLGFSALAIDIGNMLVVRNQLKNAADAGALAGAIELYNAYGTAINTSCNQTAYDFAKDNRAHSAAGEIEVDLDWTPGTNIGDVQRGHWSFRTRTFTPSDNENTTELWGKTTEELDDDVNFVNAVRVVARRSDTPVASFFAGIFGERYRNFAMSAESVAYIGFTGKINPGEVDQPIAICAESIKSSDVYSCNVGRMINSGSNVETSETGGWTDFNQDNPCSGGTNATAVKSLTCAEGNENTIFLGKPMATIGGEVQSAFNSLHDCWAAKTNKIKSWNLTLPVVTCPGNNVGTCETVVGAVNVNIVWINNQNDPHYNNVPTQMDDWSSTLADGQQRWASFVEHFNLKNVDGSPAPYQDKAIYFKPDCTPHELTGNTGGENFGVLAKYPVLVQ